MLLTTIAVIIVMSAASLITLRQREASYDAAARGELQAHALTLRVALEEDYSAGRPQYAQQLIDRLRQNTQIYSIILFDAQGEATLVSNAVTPDEIRYRQEARHAITTGETVEVERSLNGEDFFSVIMPLEVSGARVGAVEVVQPISFVRAYNSGARRDTALTAALLCVTILLVLYAVTRYSLSLPIRELLGGAVAVGRGDLTHRVNITGGGSELTHLAQAFNGMADNLTEQRNAAVRAAEDRLELERRLRHSERLAAVGHLAAGVAHEIGAPLQVIDGRAKQLQEQTAPPEKSQRNLTIIRKQTERITHIVRNLLNLSRPFHPHLSSVNAREVLGGVIELLEIQIAEAGISVDHQADEPIIVQADAALLHQVLLNICQNALQSMQRQGQQGGTLRVSYALQAAARDGRPYAALRIADTGGGIEPENLDNIFDPFFTTKEVGHGTGLGLTVSNRIIEEHGGWIEATNWEDEGQRGSLFAIYLPQ